MKLKYYAFLILLGLVLVFVLQNTEVVSLRFLFWQFAASRALLVFGIFLVGILGGYLLATLGAARRRKNLSG